MKKIVLYFLSLTFTAITLISCGSSKKGCGLTAEMAKIEQNTVTSSNTIVAVK